MNIGLAKMKGQRMNTITKTALCVWAFLLFAALEPARAFYDPGTQRWLNRDPIGDEFSLRELSGTQLQLALTIPDQAFLNLYGFGQNSPSRFIDSDGRFVIAIPIIVGGGIIIGGVIFCHFYPPCAQAAENGGRAIARTITRCIPKPTPPDCVKLTETRDLCLYKCSSPAGSFMGAKQKPYPGAPCSPTATHDEVDPMPGRGYPGFPGK